MNGERSLITMCNEDEQPSSFPLRDEAFARIWGRGRKGRRISGKGQNIKAHVLTVAHEDLRGCPLLTTLTAFHRPLVSSAPTLLATCRSSKPTSEPVRLLA